MKDKKYRKVKDHSYYTGKFRGTAHNICNLKYSVPKKIPIVFHNGSNYNYHFIIKELAEELKKITCLENTEKYIPFTVPIEKEDRRIDKYGEEIIYCNLLIEQNLWQVHYQIFTEFIELNVNMDLMIKNVKLVELNISIATVFLNTQILKMI